MGTSWAHQKLKKKKLSFRNVFFYVYPTTMNHFLTGLWHVTKSGFYTMTGNNQLSGWTEKKLQSNSQHQTCTKKRSQSLFGGLLPVWSTTASWIPVKPLYLRSMLSKLMRCTKNCNACRQHFFSRKDPRLLHNNAWLHIARAMLQKLNKLGYRVLPHPPYSPALCQLTTTSSSRLDNFLQGKSFHNQQVAENVFQEFVKPQSTDFVHYKNKQTYFLLAKMCWL